MMGAADRGIVLKVTARAVAEWHSGASINDHLGEPPMRIVSASMVLLAMVATEPAFAGCGSHGAYRSRSAKASVVVKKVVKREASSDVRTAAVATTDKPESTSLVGAVNATGSEGSPAKTVQSQANIECEEYSATVGAMISVPCS
jgi:hypothetical protein